MASKEAASGPVVPEEASPRESSTPAVSAELVETIRAVVGELLSKRRDSEGGTSSRGELEQQLHLVLVLEHPRLPLKVGRLGLW